MDKLISKVLIIGACAVAVLSIIDQFFKADFLSLQPSLCAVVILAFSIPFGCCMFVANRCKWISFIGMATSVVAIAWWVMQFDIGSATNGVSFTLTLLATSSAHIALLLAVVSEKLLVKIVKWVTVALSCVTDCAFIAGIWDLIELDDLGKDVLYSVLILVALGTVITPLMHIIYKEPAKVAVAHVSEEDDTDNEEQTAVTEESVEA
ncbi:MAG: hypothetical protein E7525_06455 [Ruminococcaceae bacterium]|nr:hypothetical protein [Oscillospiraceae bacterium]